MVLDAKRDKADFLLLPLARRMENVSPNTITVYAFLCAVFAGAFFFMHEPESMRPVYLFLALVFLSLNALLDALDGRVAKLWKKESKRGDFLDHLLDRYADIFIIGGIMLSPYCNWLLGFFALLGVLMTSYVGTQAEATGTGRIYAGMMGRADRLVILMVAIILQMVFMITGVHGIGIEGYFDFTVLEYTMIVIGVLGHATAIQRAVLAWRKI
ncbi:MAG: CDP-alcohol phosphatidyltransferase family protein [Candidatus Thermoplasmatota archaeon]|nr:CDP-alcohol phosphatidyltransferase family protein [Candidatus Thermoplasmatota archaeon]